MGRESFGIEIEKIRRHLRAAWADAARTPRRSYGIAVAAAVIAAAVMLPARDSLGILNVSLVFLLVVLGLALTSGSGAAVLAAIVSFVLFDFFFIPPYQTFSVARTDHVLALFVYLGIAIVTAQLVARVRARTEQAENEQRRTALLYDLNAALVGDVTLDAILTTIVERVVHVYRSQACRILLPDEDEVLVVRAAFPAGRAGETDRQSVAMAEWVMANRSPAGLGNKAPRVRMPHGVGEPPPPPPKQRTDVLFLPIATAQRAIGVLEVRGRPGGGRFGPDDERLLTSFADQAALALERARLSDEAARAAALAQSDELKSALLAAVSHDLRTPLAVIKASTTSLLDPAIAWSEPDRTDFLRAIDEETDRLTLMVGNLLDLSRIEGGVLRPDKEWYDVAELVEDVAGRIAPRAAAGGHRLITRIEPDLPLVSFDYVEIAQVLVNLAENAIKYTPPQTEIELTARRVTGAVELACRDSGPGIPPREQVRIFDTFYRVQSGSRVAGTGIGLAICKGLVEAHGGRLWVESSPGSGATFRFTLPLESEPTRAEPV